MPVLTVLHRSSTELNGENNEEVHLVCCGVWIDADCGSLIRPAQSAVGTVRGTARQSPTRPSPCQGRTGISRQDGLEGLREPAASDPPEQPAGVSTGQDRKNTERN